VTYLKPSYREYGIIDLMIFSSGVDMTVVPRALRMNLVVRLIIP